MKYINNFEERRQRHKALFAHERVDRCCISVRAPIGGFVQELMPNDAAERELYWADKERVYRRAVREFENTYFAGDAIPTLRLNLGAAGHAGFFQGVKHEFRDSVWFFPNEAIGSDASRIIFDPSQILYQKTIEFAKYLVEKANGDFIVSMPDITGNADVLAHLIGSDNLLYDLYDEPEFIEEALKTIQKVFLGVCAECFEIYKNAGQTANSIGWLTTYCEGTHMQMQCDLSVMVSNAMFRKFFLSELREQADYFDYPLYHLDGQEQRAHLDDLLSIEKLNMIQWTSVAGQPQPIHFIDSLRKIQKAGKGLLLTVTPAEVSALLENLSSRGLYLVVKASTPEEADEVVRCAERLSHD
ncbi:hypothetical protein SDC9_70640 [bioreactor metagenome]|uniref:Uroporphyrinogen decarboxylase (URO-D) domain-containing protein n=1 Tax=bioreactor metagenome TaxID=1076179 RepID=A0A644Y782_9ZZZZ